MWVIPAQTDPPIGSFEHRGRFLLFGEAMGKKANKKSGDGEHRRGDDEKIRWTNLTDVMLGDVGPRIPPSVPPTAMKP